MSTFMRVTYEIHVCLNTGPLLWLHVLHAGTIRSLKFEVHNQERLQLAGPLSAPICA
jgi:hypothetical protein